VGGFEAFLSDNGVRGRWRLDGGKHSWRGGDFVGEERNCVGKEDFVRRRVDSGWRAFFLE
jgi:hypothetical protein